MLRQLIISGFVVSSLKFGNALLSMAITILLTRHIGAEGFGIYAYAITALAIAIVPMGRGWGLMIIRTASASLYNEAWKEPKGMAKFGKWPAILISTLFIVLGLLIGFQLDFFQSGQIGPIIMLLLGSTLLFDQMSAIRVASIRSFEKPQLAQIPDQLAKPFMIIIGIVLALNFMETKLNVFHVFLIVSIAACLNYIIGSIMMTRLSPKSLTTATATPFKTDWLKKSLLLAGGPALIVLNNYTDILMLGLFLEPKDIGLYKVAAQVAIFAGLGYTALNFIAAQKIALLKEQGSRHTLQKYVTLLSRLAVLTVIPVPIILYLFGDQLIAFVFGPDFSAALYPMIILAFLQLISASFGMCNIMLVMHGYEKLIIRYTAICLIANIVLCAILIPAYGIIGAACSNLIATSLWNFLLWFTVLRKVKIDTGLLGLHFSTKAA